jgi:hypothetical protein
MKIRFCFSLIVFVFSIINGFSQELRFEELESITPESESYKEYLEKSRKLFSYSSYKAKDGTIFTAGSRFRINSPFQGAKYFEDIFYINLFTAQTLQKKYSGMVAELKKITIGRNPQKKKFSAIFQIELVTGEFEFKTYINFESALERNEIEILASDNDNATRAVDNLGISRSKNVKLFTPTGIGTLSSKVKYLDVDQVYPFSEGFAIVKKGTAEGVINQNGEMVVPFNKWQFVGFNKSYGTVTEGFKNGHCVVKAIGTTELYGMINSKGVVIIPCENTIVFPFDDFGLAVVIKDENYYFVNDNNEKFLVSEAFLVKSNQVINESGGMEALFGGPATLDFLRKKGMVDRTFTKNGISIGRSKDGGFAVFDKNGVVKTKNRFKNARHFYEGLAAVCNQNEFGEDKWGFIDEAGDLVIPLIFSNPPGDFSEGLAFVTPVDKSDFHYAYIDKKGEVALKIKMNLRGSNKNFTLASTRFQSGYAFLPYDEELRGFVLINEFGKSQSEILNNSIGSEGHLWKPDLELTNGQLLSQGGLLNLLTGLFIPRNSFSSLTAFDPISELAMASKEGISGYIDTTGQFVIVISKKSKW